MQWAAHLSRLEGTRRDAVIAALRHSDATGWPAPGEAVELLVSYALGEITAHDYATGILHTLGMDDRASRTHPVAPASTSPHPAAVESVPAAEAPASSAPGGSARPPISREDAVHAYVTGQIPVGEFLRLARG